jgi:F-type H+-transporting ATPase subunit epsilon
MSNDFHVEILTPAGEVLKTEASEVLLPSYRGELGILPGHEDLVGLLSTGTLKVVRSGNDFWYVVSGGAFKIDNSVLTVFAEFGTSAESLHSSSVDKDLAEVRDKLKAIPSTHDDEHKTLREKEDRLIAMQEAIRRQSMS